MTPLISVVVPSFNHAPYVEAMARSVLDQGIDDLQLIVADDGSIDGSLEILRRLAATDPRLRVLRHGGGLHRGRLPTLLLGMGEATGRFVAVLGSDDRWLPDKLGAQLDALESGAFLSYGRARHVDPDDRPLPTSSGRSPEEIGLAPLEALCLENYIPAATAAFPLKAYRRAGGFDAAQAYEDYALWLRLCALGEPTFEDRFLAEYRVSPLGTDSRIRSLGRDLLAMHSAIEAVLHWRGLPERHRDVVASWERVYRAVAGSISGAPREELRPEDEPRLARLRKDKAGRLLELAGPGADAEPATDDHLVRGCVDLPAPDATIPAGTVEVEGWALEGGARPQAVVVSIDGGPVVEARLGLLRPDVAREHRDLPGARLSGWAAQIDVAAGGAESVRIEARARRADGEMVHLGSTEVSVVSPEP